MSIFWITAAVIFAVVEMVTVQLVCIWFAAGSLAAFAASAFNMNITWQIMIFVICSAVLFALSKPVVKKLRGEKISTNSDRLVGKTVIISEQVDNLKEQGRARVSGIDWSVRSLDGDVIQKGEKAVIKDIQGVKLIVTPEKEEGHPPLRRLQSSQCD